LKITEKTIKVFKENTTRSLASDTYSNDTTQLSYHFILSSSTSPRW